MKYAVISDVHSNLDALETVLSDIEHRGIQDVVFIGDAVGYGPSPNECIEILSGCCKTLIAGNHDWGVIGLSDISCFNEYARRAVEWTSEVTEEKNKEILRSFPLISEDKNQDAFFVHATPQRPEEWHYLLSHRDAELTFYGFDTRFCFLGHSHQPFIIERGASGELVTYKDGAQIREGGRYIINAGSVGQPRDGDPRASFAVIDYERVEIIRIPYDIKTVQDKMRKELLPYPLIERLAVGR